MKNERKHTKQGTQKGTGTYLPRIKKKGQTLILPRTITKASVIRGYVCLVFMLLNTLSPKLRYNKRLFHPLESKTLKSFIIFSLLASFTLCPWAAAHSKLTASNDAALRNTLNTLEQQLDGRIGVTIYDVASQQQWSYNGEYRVPLMSTFKTLACAKLLNDANTKKIDLQLPITIQASDILAYAPVTKDKVGQNMTLAQLCEATMLTSDNSAANIVLRHIGGPSDLTRFLRQHGDSTTRLDRNEPKLNQVGSQEIRDTTTPAAMAHTLAKLLYQDSLSKPAQQTLLRWLQDNKVSDPLLRSVLPAQWQIADRSGYDSQYGSRAITAAVWSPSQSPLIITIYLGQTHKSIEQLNKAIAEIGAAIFTVIQQK